MFMRAFLYAENDNDAMYVYEDCVKHIVNYIVERDGLKVKPGKEDGIISNNYKEMKMGNKIAAYKYNKNDNNTTSAGTTGITAVILCMRIKERIRRSSIM